MLSGEGGLTSWVAGLYYRDQQQTLLREYTYAEGDFASRYDTENVAAYGQLDIPLGERFALVSGMRWERREFDYADNSAPSSAAGNVGRCR